MYLVILLVASLYSSTLVQSANTLVQSTNTLVQSANTLVQSAKQYDLKKAREYFKNFTVTYNKKYRDEGEREYRFYIFRENLKVINNLNIEYDGDGEYGINQFTDIDPEQFLDDHTGHRNRRDDYDKDEDDLCDILKDKDIPDVTVPESLDWRLKNVVTPAKDQGNCGSCWAFAASGYLESQYALKYNKTIKLSEQHIMDCDRVSDGCCGGFPSLAFSAIIKAGGLNQENYYYSYNPKSSYKPWYSRDYLGNGVHVVNCHLYKISCQEKVKQLLYKNGPIVAAIRASGLQHFEGSHIISDKQCGRGEINQAVLLVGYGTENGKPYWILKNSWGTDFGKNGFFKIERSENQDGNCGLLKSYFTTATIG